jgi:HEAT repeat protein
MPQIQDWIRLYSSTNRRVRLRAAQGLLKRADEAPLDLLIDILVNWHDEGLGASAEHALLQRRDVDLVPRMIDVLRSPDYFARAVACKVLGRSGDKTATPFLMRLVVDDPHGFVRRGAGFGLAFLKDRSVLDELRGLHKRHREGDLVTRLALEDALKGLEDGAAQHETHGDG